MDAYESGMWILRLALVLVVTVLLVIIASLTIPNIQATELHADIIAARVAYNGGFSQTGGVVIKDNFTQEVASQFLMNGADTPLQIAASATLAVNGELVGPIVYNKQGYEILSVARNLKGIQRKEYSFPVAVITEDGSRQEGVLIMEVLYGE